MINDTICTPLIDENGPFLTASQLLCAKVLAKGSIKQAAYKWTKADTYTIIGVSARDK